MAMQQKLGMSTRLSQRLILTPSLQQAIKLLPLTTLELAEVLEQEVMENPLLEEVPQEQLSAEEIAAEEATAKEDKTDPLKEIDVEKFFEDYLDDGDHRRTRSQEIPELPPIENTLTETPDLYDHLMWQLHMAVSDETILEIVHTATDEALGFIVAQDGEYVFESNLEEFFEDFVDESADSFALRLYETLRADMPKYEVENKR